MANRPTRPPADRQPEPLQIVTIPLHELERYVQEAAERGYRKAAEERERLMSALADDLDKPHRKPVLTVQEAADYAHRDPATIRRWIKDGLPAARRSGTAGYRIKTTDLEAWMTDQPSSGGGVPKARPSLASRSSESNDLR